MSKIITIIIFTLAAITFVMSACHSADCGEFLERMAFALVALGFIKVAINGH